MMEREGKTHRGDAEEGKIKHSGNDGKTKDRAGRAFQGWTEARWIQVKQHLLCRP